MAFNERRLTSNFFPIISFGLGFISIILSIIVGYSAFNSSQREFEQQYREFYLREAKTLVTSTQFYKSDNDQSTLKNIQRIWESKGKKPDDEYLCVVDQNSNLILHTAHPKTVGNYAGENLISIQTNASEACLGDLVISKEDYVGDYISSAGQHQLAAFSHIPDKNWVIGIHRSKQALIDDIKYGLKNSKAGFYLVCIFLMPLSWFMIYLVFYFNEKKRKKAETALKDNQKLFQDVVEKLPFPFVVGTTDKKTEYLNPRFTQVFGYTVEDIPDQKAWQEKFFPNPEYRAKILNEVNNWIKKDKYSTVFERRYTDKWGHDHDVVVTLMNLKDRFYNILEDVTEQKKAQKDKEKLQLQLNQAQKIESIGILAGGIAHDFNNLLFPIVGMAELLLEDLPPDSLEYSNAKEILKAGKRASHLVKQILAFSRQSELEMRPVWIQRVLKETLKLGRSVIPSNIEIKRDIQKDCGLVLLDPSQLHQVIMNLVTNAYHAVERKGGTVSVQLKEKKMDSEVQSWDTIQPGRYAVLSISDTGEGIDPDVIGRIFDPYFTTKKPGKGTGLGLAVVYGIVREHKGDIKVSSELGKGTTFDVYFPIMAESSESVSDLGQQILKTGSESVLLVDDEEPIGRLVRQMLHRLGYNVTLRTGSLEALALFQADPDRFDLVITDMTMPNMTGDQLAKEVMSKRPDIPVIIFTGFSEKINPEKAVTIGVKGLLMKPVDKSEMATMVRKVLDDVKK